MLPAPLAYYTPREPELQRLYCGGQRALRRLAHQQMNVLGHHHVCQHYPAIAPPYSFQHFEEQVPTLRGCQQRLAAIATEGYEVQVVSAMPAFQAPRHANKVQGTLALRCDGEHTIPVTRERSPGSRTARDPGHPGTRWRQLAAARKTISILLWRYAHRSRPTGCSRWQSLSCYSEP